MQKELLLNSVYLFYIQICIYIYMYSLVMSAINPLWKCQFIVYTMAVKVADVKSKVFVCLYFICVYS